MTKLVGFWCGLGTIHPMDTATASPHASHDTRPGAMIDARGARIGAAAVATSGIVVVASNLVGAHLAAAVVAAVLCVDFTARVVFGPRRSLIGQIAGLGVRQLGGEPQPVSWAPKRFAATMGAVMSAVVAATSIAAPGVATVVAVVLVTCAVLEAGVGFCVGCVIWGRLVRAGVVTEPCATCAPPVTERVTVGVAGARR